MHTHRLTVSMRNLGFLLLAVGLAACVRDPQAYIPETQRAVLELEGGGSAKAQPITVEELLARAAGQASRNSGTGPLTLGFAPGSATLADAESSRLNAALATWPSASRVRLLVGGTEGDNPFAALALAQRRAATVEKRLPKAWPPAETL